MAESLSMPDISKMCSVSLLPTDNVSCSLRLALMLSLTECWRCRLCEELAGVGAGVPVTVSCSRRGCVELRPKRKELPAVEWVDEESSSGAGTWLSGCPVMGEISG